MTRFDVGQFVLLQYILYNIINIVCPAGQTIGALSWTFENRSHRPDIIKVKDLTTNKVSSVHTSRLWIFRRPTKMTREEIDVLVSINLDEIYAEKVVEHEDNSILGARTPRIVSSR